MANSSPLTVADRFYARVSIQESGCWLWTGSTAGKGYGKFWTGMRQQLAHIFAYEQARGPVPAGLQIDHLCRVRACVNPNHMEAVTCHVNVVVRGTGPTAENARKTVCKEGHPFVRVDSRGWRMCLKCEAARARKYRKQKREPRRG